MRRKDREITKIHEINELLDSLKICRIAVNDEDGIYIFPVNFGYSYNKDNLEIYFHGAKAGKRFDILNKEKLPAGFEADIEYGIVENKNVCDYSFKYASIIGKGEAEIIREISKKTDALKILMRHQTGRDFKLDEEMVEKTAVFKVILHEYTCKKHI